MCSEFSTSGVCVTHHQVPPTILKWGTMNAEIKVLSTKNQSIRGFLLYTWSGSEYNVACFSYCQESWSSYSNVLQPWFIQFNFSRSSSNFTRVVNSETFTCDLIHVALPWYDLYDQWVSKVKWETPPPTCCHICIIPVAHQQVPPPKRRQVSRTEAAARDYSQSAVKSVCTFVYFIFTHQRSWAYNLAWWIYWFTSKLCGVVCVK